MTLNPDDDILVSINWSFIKNAKRRTRAQLIWDTTKDIPTCFNKMAQVLTPKELTNLTFQIMQQANNT